MTAAAWTAIGTIALAAATLSAVSVTIVITRQDRKKAASLLVDERDHAAAVLADERKAADDRLARQLKHSDKQLADERAAAEQRLRAQLEHATAQQQAENDQRQLTEAYAVQVVVAQRPAGEATGNVQQPDGSEFKILAVMVVNRGQYAITEIEARLSADGRTLQTSQREERYGGYDNLARRLTDTYAKLDNPVAQGNVLGPRDSDIGMRFETGLVPEHGIEPPGPYAVVRWRDRWAQRWEHKQGTVRKIDNNAAWLA